MNFFKSAFQKRTTVASLLVCPRGVMILIALLAQSMAPTAKLTAQVAVQVQNQIQIRNAAQATLVESYLRRIHLDEQKFLARVCALAEEQEKQINRLELDWKAEAAKFGPNANAANARAVVMGRVLGAGASAPLQIADKFRASTRKRFSELLTEEQQNAYKAELTAREDFQRRANAECLMALLSQVLTIRPEQVPSLTDDLATWDGARALQLDNYFRMIGNGNSYIPNIPEALVNKHLDANQRAVFRGIRKADIQRPWMSDDMADGGQLGE